MHYVELYASALGVFIPTRICCLFCLVLMMPANFDMWLSQNAEAYPDIHIRTSLTRYINPEQTKRMQ